MSTPTHLAPRAIKTAEQQVGYHEGRSGGHWNNQNKFAVIAGHPNGQAWCVTFLVAVFKLLDAVAGIIPNTASCDVAGAWFKSQKRWSEYPAIGAWVFFGTPRDLSHVGLVYRFNETYIWTIEGNTNDSGSREGDGVYLKRHARRAARVVGYGYPKYPEGIISADPKWKSAAPKAPSSKPPVVNVPATPRIDAQIRSAQAVAKGTKGPFRTAMLGAIAALKRARAIRKARKG